MAELVVRLGIAGLQVGLLAPGAGGVLGEIGNSLLADEARCAVKAEVKFLRHSRFLQRALSVVLQNTHFCDSFVPYYPCP